MEIFLINPSHGEVYGKLTPPDHPHLGLAYIAAVLEAEKHVVRIVDIDAEVLSNEELGRIIESGKPDMVGITATTPVFYSALKIAETVKKNSSAYTVIGGMHATLMPVECAESNFIDFVVVGEGEKTVIELLNAIQNKSDFSNIKGLAYKKGKEIIRNEVREPIQDLDAIPFPARHLFKNQKYTYPDALRYPACPIITSRGCPGNCTFCTAKFLHGKRFRCRSAENILDEIESLIKDYGVREIHIWDDNFITNRNRVFAFRDGIIKRNIKALFSFPNGIRADFINRDILKALKDFGTYSVAIGVESGNQNILDMIQKGIKLEQIENAFKLAREMKLETWGFFLLGLPGEDKNTMNDTIDFAIKLDPDIAKFHVLKPFPKSVVYEQLKAQGLIIDENYAHYGIHTKPVHRLPSVTQDELLEFQKNAYRRFYMRPSKIFKEIVRLKTWNRMKLNFSTGTSVLINKIFSS
ncbi:MAG: radical SAM protein [Victivallales bacterium]